MTDHDRDPLIDELRAALDVAPSADFAARVRRAIGERRTRARWIVFSGVGLAAAACAVVMVWPRSEQPEGGQPPAVQTAAATQAGVATPAAPPSRSSYVAVRERHSAAPEQTGAIHPDAGVPEPELRPDLEVMVPFDEGLAMTRLMASLEAHASSVPMATRPAEDANGLLMPPDPITIPELSIPSLTGPGGRAVQEKRR